jgi:hypothetical protein
MPWQDHATKEELSELDRLRGVRDKAAATYNAFYSKLMRRCQSRTRQAVLKATREAPNG